MKFYYVDGPFAGTPFDSLADRSVHPPLVRKLRCEVDVWLGDVLLEFYPCWIVTASAKEVISSAGLTGVQFDSVEVFKSDQFQEFEPDTNLPAFAWLKVTGNAGQDDFGVAENLRLVVSRRALKVLQGLGIPNAKISDFVS
jgi:hypothetical protein